MSDLSKLKKFYKGIVVHKIYVHLRETPQRMTRKQIDEDIKINAEFPYKSITDPQVTKEDLQNLIVWGFMYADEVGAKDVDYPEDELDKMLYI